MDADGFYDSKEMKEFTHCYVAGTKYVDPFEKFCDPEYLNLKGVLYQKKNKRK